MNRARLPARYRNVRHLAEGWSSEVYAADLITPAGASRNVVLKILRTDVPGPEGEARDVLVSGLREAFAREAMALTACAGPGIPTFIEPLDLGVPVLALSAIDGVSLEQHVRANGPLPFTEARRVMERLLEIVGRIHRLGWVHSDLNPRNVFLDGDMVWLLDFGAAWRQGMPPNWRWPLGRHRFMGPEQLLGRHSKVPYERAGAQSDVHQAACLLSFLVTGKEPFRYPLDEETYGTDYLDQLGAFMALPVGDKMASLALEGRYPGIPPGTDALLARALAPAPKDRFDDAEVFRWALGQLARPTRAAKTPPGPVRDPKRWQTALATEGFFEPHEAALLIEHVARAPEDARILEVGSYKGRSALFGLSALGPFQRWTCVDSFRTAASYSGHSADDLRRCLDDPRVEVIDSTLAEAEAVLADALFSVALIDGDHSLAGVIADSTRAISRMPAGSILLFHDYNDLFPGVVRAIDLLRDAGVLRTVGQAGSLVALKIVGRPTWLLDPGVYRDADL